MKKNTGFTDYEKTRDINRKKDGQSKKKSKAGRSKNNQPRNGGSKDGQSKNGQQNDGQPQGGRKSRKKADAAKQAAKSGAKSAGTQSGQDRKLFKEKEKSKNSRFKLKQRRQGGRNAASGKKKNAIDTSRQFDFRQASPERISHYTYSGVAPVPGSKVKIIFLGGLEQIGMNITAFESENSIVVVDCGMAFPDDTMLGVDLVIPDITYLKEHIDKIEGFFITHGHEDHIGALPYVLREINVPVYSTRLTRALIENKLREHGLIESSKLNTVTFGDTVEAGDFKVEFIKTNHSIQDAAALAIHSPAGVILHTGDFKVDYTPVYGDTIDLQRFAELGRKGVLALLADSTNAVRAGFTMSERTVGHTFDTIFGEYTDKRIVVATFASNVDRVQQVVYAAEKYGRKVVIDGRSMVNIIGTAVELGYINFSKGTLIDISEIKNYPPEKTVLVVTGSQGESMAVLSRMATGQHRKLTLSDKDVIIMSSNPIPGNEKAVSKVINELSRLKTKVIYQDTHVSGHACAEDLKLIYALVHPKFAIPVHGEVRHRLAQRDIAIAVGVPKDRVLLADTGDVVDLSEDSCRVTETVQAGPVMVDGLGIGDVGNVVLRDRQNLSQNGIIIVAIAIDQASGELMSDPEIVTRGFIYVRDNEDVIDEAKKTVYKALDDCRGSRDAAHIRNVIRNEVSDYIWRRMKRTPMILSVIAMV